MVAVPNQSIRDLGLDSKYNLSVLNVSSRGLELRNSWGTTVERPPISLSKEGVFEMTTDSIRRYIDHILIVETIDTDITSTLQSKHESSFYSCYSFKVKGATQGVISVSQWDSKLFPVNSYRYSPFTVVIEKKNG